MARMTAYEWLVGLVDKARWHFWLRLNNGSSHLQAAYEAVDDVDDCLISIACALRDGDHEEALTLIELSRATIKDHIKTLKGLL